MRRDAAQRREGQSRPPRAGGDGLGVSLTLPARLTSVSRARTALDSLERIVPGRVLEDLRLLVSELVTNSLRHSGAGPGDSIRLRLDVARDGVRVEVEDDGPGFEAATPSRPAPERTGGRGLWLVDLLASRWGVVRKRGTCVWLEIDLPAPALL